MNFRVVLAVVVLAGLVVVGGAAWKGLNDWSGFATRIEAKQQLCSTLTDAERLDLVGVATPTRLTGAEGALDRYTCRWATPDYKSVAEFVEVVSAPADVWAAQTKNAFMERPDVGTAARNSLLGKAARQPIRTAAEGCRFAQRLFALNGATAGATRVVSPSTYGPQQAPMMVAQSCVGGTYSAVLVTAPGLTLDRSLARRTAQALRAAEHRLS